MHAVWDREVAGSNPVFPTIRNLTTQKRVVFLLYFFATSRYKKHYNKINFFNKKEH